MAAPGGVISPEIAVIFRAIDQLSAEVGNMQAAITNFNESVKGIKEGAETVPESTEKVRISMRGVALDLRMISIATAIFRRELGTTNPVIDAMSRGLLILSTSATAALAAVDLLSKAAALSTLGWAGLTAAIKGAGAALIGFLANPIVALVVGIALVIAGIVALIHQMSPAQQAAAYFADEMTRLKQATEDAKLAVETLQYQMEALQIQEQRLRLQEMELEYAIERRGFSTKEEEALLVAVRGRTDEVSMSMARQRLSISETEHAMKGYQMRMADIERTVAALPQWGWAPGYIPEVAARPTPEALPPSPYPYGQRGVPEPIFMARVADLPRRMGAALVSVNISFPGAIFRTAIDIQEEMRKSGEVAASEIRRRL